MEMPEAENLEGVVGEYGDLLTTNPRIYCEDCEKLVYVTSPDKSHDTHYYFECACCIVSPEDRPENWHSVSDLVN